MGGTLASGAGPTPRLDLLMILGPGGGDFACCDGLFVRLNCGRLTDRDRSNVGSLERPGGSRGREMICPVEAEAGVGGGNDDGDCTVPPRPRPGSSGALLTTVGWGSNTLG